MHDSRFGQDEPRQAKTVAAGIRWKSKGFSLVYQDKRAGVSKQVYPLTFEKTTDNKRDTGSYSLCLVGRVAARRLTRPG